MTPSSACIVIFLFMRFNIISSESRPYSTKPECDDMTSNFDLQGEYLAQSLCLCSAMCDVSCSCFGFHPHINKCRIHRSCDVTNMTSLENGWRYYELDPPPDCKSIQSFGINTSGFYDIYPYGDKEQNVKVYCDMVTEDGGWTAIQRRLSGTINFNRTWLDFKNGFGVTEDSYWIGNDIIHQLTDRQQTSLYVYFKFNNGDTFYKIYDDFSVGDESTKYELSIQGPAGGNLGDSMINTGDSKTDLRGMQFSTFDQDNDKYTGHCARKYGSGWWFNNCHDAFLNGPWPPDFWHEPWFPEFSDGTNMAEVRLMIKAQ